MTLRHALVPLVLLCLVATPAPSVGAAPATPSALATTTLALPHPSTLSAKWRNTATLPYGSATSRPGTSPGGEGLEFGPSYGVQLPDRTWWVLDTAKRRLAHFSDAGNYLGQAVLPARYLHLGVYVQWANPQALADGTVVLTSTTIDAPGLLLRSPAGRFTRVGLDRFVNVVIGNGHSLYGFDEDNTMVRVRPRTGTITTVTDFVGQGGHAFRIRVGAGQLRVRRPGVNLRLNLVDKTHPAATVFPSVEAAMGADGKLWILASGIVETSPGSAHDVVGLFAVGRTGSVSVVFKSRTLTSDADPGDGHRLSLRHGGTRPTLMFIDPDAVRVYRKK